MTKQEALRMTRQAKSAHIRWRAYVHALLAGLQIEERHAPVSHKECDFGQWFYQDGFKAFAHWQIFQDVEYSHELLHAVYQLIHQAMEEDDKARAALLAEQLMGISNALLTAIDVLEDEIFASEQLGF